jgi:L-aspartate oxidase
LAPRDVVARAIVSEMSRTGAPHVFLDLTHRGETFIRQRFPRIYETCLRYGVNIGLDPAPVAPAAHYAMGGVRTDLEGRTNVARLFAAGEAACTGVHGANRLASNSLLEGVVFGIRAGRAMREAKGAGVSVPGFAARSVPESVSAPAPGSAAEIQRIAWQNCGIVRSADGLREAAVQLEALAPQSPEERNMRQVVLLIARCALARQESRGAHFRTDFPETREAFARHSVVARGADVTFR